MPYSSTLVQAKQETEHRTVFTDAENASDSPAYECASYREQKPDVELVRTVHGGTKAMRATREEMLPRQPMEQPKKYDVRLAQALAYNALKKTKSGLNGMIFRRAPTYSDTMPVEVQGDADTNGHLDDIDLQGRAFPVFWRAVADEALLDGHTWVQVEAPPRRPDVRNRGEERSLGVRPYWINIKKAQAINWRYEMRAGRPVLTLFVYREGHSEPDGEFGEVARQRIRVLREMRQAIGATVQGEVWEFRKHEADAAAGSNNTRDRWVRIQAYALDPRITRIPVIAVYAERDGIFRSTPPLLDLAYEQIEHYRVRSDRQKSITFASLAVPYCFGEGVTDQDGAPIVKWAADGMMLLNDPNAQAGMLESHGYGLEATKDELREIEGRMAAMGLSMLARSEGVQPDTATSELIDKAESDAWISVFAKSLEDAANECLDLHALVLGEPTAGMVTLSRDFERQLISPQMFRELNASVAAGNLSLDTLWDIAERGGLLWEGFDHDEERERIEADDARSLQALPPALAQAAQGAEAPEPVEDDAMAPAA